MGGVLSSVGGKSTPTIDFKAQNSCNCCGGGEKDEERTNGDEVNRNSPHKSHQNKQVPNPENKPKVLSFPQSPYSLAISSGNVRRLQQTRISAVPMDSPSPEPRHRRVSKHQDPSSGIGYSTSHEHFHRRVHHRHRRESAPYTPMSGQYERRESHHALPNAGKDSLSPGSKPRNRPFQDTPLSQSSRVGATSHYLESPPSRMTTYTNTPDSQEGRRTIEEEITTRKVRKVFHDHRRGSKNPSSQITPQNVRSQGEIDLTLRPRRPRDMHPGETHSAPAQPDIPHIVLPALAEPAPGIAHSAPAQPDTPHIVPAEPAPGISRFALVQPESPVVISVPIAPPADPMAIVELNQIDTDEDGDLIFV